MVVVLVCELVHLSRRRSTIYGKAGLLVIDNWIKRYLGGDNSCTYTDNTTTTVLSHMTTADDAEKIGDE